MASPTQTNGNGKVVWYILQVVVGLLVMACGAWVTTLQNDIGKVEDRVEALRDKYDQIAPTLATITVKIEDMARRQESMDRKLDRLARPAR